MSPPLRSTVKWPESINGSPGRDLDCELTGGIIMAECGPYGKFKEVRPRMWVAFAGFLCTLAILIAVSSLARRSVASGG